MRAKISRSWIVVAIVFGLIAGRSDAGEFSFQEFTGDGAAAAVPDVANAPTGEIAYDATDAYIQQEEAAPGWKLPQPCFLQKHGIILGGWLQQGITFSNHADDAFNGPVGTDDFNGEYQMNQMWLFLDRPVQNNGEGWAWGGHVDMVYGSDWRFGINHGLEDRINGFNRQSYGFILPQAYLELAYNNLSVKLGHFAGILGYEVVPAPANPFYSHSYAMAFGEPLLVTGLMSDYKLSDQWSILAGFHRGWMMFEDNNDTLDFMGGVQWTSSSKKTSLNYALSTGPQDAAGVKDRFVSSLVFKHQLTKRLQYVLQHVLGREKNAVRVGQSGEWYGINQYFLCKLNRCWSANLRVEWFRDDDGVRVAGPPAAAGIRAWPLSGFAGNFYELTAGLNWRPNPNVLIRPEVRWDWYNGLANSAGKLPFNNGNSSDQFLVAADLILTF